MTTPGTQRREGRDLAVLAGGAVVGVLVGAGTAGAVVGAVIDRTALWAGGAGLVAFIVVAGFVHGAVREARRPDVDLVTALARIESRRAISGDSADVPLALDLTVAPEGGTRFRVRATHAVNLVDLPDYPEGGTVVVRYRPDEPWKVTLVTRPTEDWRQRAAAAVIHPARETTRATDPERLGPGFCLLGVLGLLTGAALVVLLFAGSP